jgi:uncharacterized metal-binding protein YceD (DUF177 family)
VLPRLEDAVLDLDRRGSTRRTPRGRGSCARSLENDQLDLSAWARDASRLELPDKILCKDDCASLCRLRQEPEPGAHDHGEPEPDSRWSALAELRDRL